MTTLSLSAQADRFDRSHCNDQLSLNLPVPPTPATRPPEERGIARDEVKLLVLDRRTGRTEHGVFHRLADYLQPGDLLVVNTSKTLAASLPALLLRGGEPMRIHLASRITSTTYIVERRDAQGAADERPFQVGDRIAMGTHHATVIGRFHPNSRLWYLECNADLWQLAETIGRPIRYGYLQSQPDLADFQTVFARDLGSAEMPSAGRPFTERVLAGLAKKGIRIAEITLHTGVSSHEVKGALSDHPFLPEWYSVPEVTAELVNEARAQGRRVIAVGTTVVRALATTTDPATGLVRSESGWTTVVITPDTPVPSITGLVTGLHDNDTSHLAMLYAFVQRDALVAAYTEAVARGYLWHEFGDSNLILSC
ncbi:S-adenosylmethionine:tRNA ribosyltransferase-isomerase [Alicyclobacillus fastidiosus]|uniref:S-adenosylmethionine:tRNA ribosyltransferase-isomerase n=1 Tax=Alicyclobacillus fastidiosus TaxID=392011 RepID=A0ABV5AE66_9BACL|nr:S-adenosylmethionine:tRNA ribosyltransferase-isomerase [Alicyclobacillus fastidiosus]WEH11945.1 S-adenosylmethionine:tRNA ribosyltransferase-isomerase [Alicyclobacillus fastidiosus]